MPLMSLLGLMIVGKVTSDGLKMTGDFFSSKIKK